MKIGKQPGRFGGPSQEFRRKRDEAERVAREAAARVVPADGPIRVYLDDDRPCPKGWTLVRSKDELFALLDGDTSAAARIERLSLDWHLGADQGRTGFVVRPNGEAVATALADRFRADDQFLPTLEIVHFHSSDPDKAIVMLRTIMAALSDTRLDDVYLDIGAPE